jgi:WD40 repeat protein
MTEHDNDAESRLRAMLRDAAVEIHPSRPAPGLVGPSPSRNRRRSTWGLSIGLAVCLVVGTLVALDVHAIGGSSNGGLAVGGHVSGALLVADSDGAVRLLDPDTGAVLRTLVGPSPVDSSGRHLKEPEAITAANQAAYVAYDDGLHSVIESIPFSGGTPQYVTSGMDPSASPDGTRLAFVRLVTGSSGSASEPVVIRDLATGSEQAVDTTTGFGFVESLSWSPDGTQLAVSGIFTPTARPGSVGGIDIGVQILTVDQPTSATNPRFLGPPRTLGGLGTVASGVAVLPTFTLGTPAWTDGQFLASGGGVAVLAVTSSVGVCQSTHTSILVVDPATGETTTLATVPFSVSGAVFDPAGNLVALQRDLPPRRCHEATTTTTTTTTVPGLSGVSSSSFSTGTAYFSFGRLELDRWSAGTSSKLADGVVAVTFVPAPD